MITSSLSPTSVTSVVRSSRPHGESRLLTLRPQLRVAHLERSGDLDETGAGRLLVGHRDRVFEVAEQDVDGRDDLGQLGDDLVDVRREEVDDAARPERDLAHRRPGHRQRGV